MRRAVELEEERERWLDRIAVPSVDVELMHRVELEQRIDETSWQVTKRLSCPSAPRPNPCQCRRTSKGVRRSQARHTSGWTRNEGNGGTARSASVQIGHRLVTTVRRSGAALAGMPSEMPCSTDASHILSGQSGRGGLAWMDALFRDGACAAPGGPGSSDVTPPEPPGSVHRRSRGQSQKHPPQSPARHGRTIATNLLPFKAGYLDDVATCSTVMPSLLSQAGGAT